MIKKNKIEILRYEILIIQIFAIKEVLRQQLNLKY